MMYLVNGTRFVVNWMHLKFSWETNLEGIANWLSQEADSEMAMNIPVGDYSLHLRINNTCQVRKIMPVGLSRVKLGCNAASRDSLPVTEWSIWSCPGLEWECLASYPTLSCPGCRMPLERGICGDVSAESSLWRERTTDDCQLAALLV